MKILFFSNFFNHHQQPLSDALWELTQGNYCFVQAEEMPRERQLLGYPSLERSYVLPLKGNEPQVEQWLREADVVITGSAPEAWVRKRIRQGKLLLRYSERPLRNGPELLKYLPRWFRWHWRNPRNKPIYLLCASGYAAQDYGMFGLFRNRAYRWGYFPETRHYDLEGLFEKKCPGEILWVGRFLENKHPEAAVEAARQLHQEGISFHMTMVGRGPLERKLREMVKAYDLERVVSFPGPMPPEQVRSAMERAGIFLFTSDRREGWGAVLNEAMNSGCAVVASDAIGAVPYLLEHGQNGLCYPSGNRKALTEAVRTLLASAGEQRRLGTGAYRTITDMWNAEAAAGRIVSLAQWLLNGEQRPELYPDGPCSKDPDSEKKGSHR